MFSCLTIEAMSQTPGLPFIYFFYKLEWFINQRIQLDLKLEAQKESE